MNITNAKNFSWIDVESPSAEDVEFLRRKFTLHPVIVEELKQPTLRPKVDVLDGYIYLALHFPEYDAGRKTSVGKEIDFIITHQDIVTLHYDRSAEAEELVALCSDPHFQEKYMGGNNIEFLRYMLEYFFEFSLRQLDHIHKKIEKIEEKIYAGREKETLRAIFMTKRDLLDFRRTIRPQRTVIDSLTLRGEEFFGASTKPYFESILSGYLRVWDMLETHQETLNTLYETNNSLLNNKTNETMKFLTVMATLTFPLTLIASIFGTNFITPGAQNPYSFWLFILCLLLILLLMIFFLRLKKLF